MSFLVAAALTLGAGVGAQSPVSVQAAPGVSADDKVLSMAYVDRVNHALEQGTDHWGDKLIALPDGPTLENVKPLLVPANHGGTTTAASPWYYLPFTYPAPDPAQWAEQRDFSLHVADGSELMSQWSDARATQHVTFYVGADGTERFGAAEAKSDDPRLTGGYLPILANSYRDAAGVRYERESFATQLVAGGPVVSMLRFVVQPPRGASTKLRVNLRRAGIEGAVAGDGKVRLDGKTVAAYSGDAQWSAPDLSYDVDRADGRTEIYLVIANEPSDLGDVRPSAALYREAKERTSAYWDTQLSGGATVQLPERYAEDAMRNTLLNNLVMGFNLTVGNGYENVAKSFAFVPEVAATVTSLSDFGFRDKARANIVELLGRGQGSFFTTWERGIKLQTVATYYLQSNDKSLVVENLATFKEWLADFARQRAADPNGLLTKARYASDIGTPVYGVHHQSDVWRGMRDLGVALRLLGQPDEAKPFLDEAAELRTALLSAVERSKTVLPDGSVFVPISLLDPSAATPYDKVTNHYLGSYWNLIMPYAMATGLFEPGSAIATGLRDYLDKHGALFLGLTRFNLSTADVGVCQNVPANQWPAIAGYKSSGIDQQYGYSLMRFYADNRESDRLDLSFYGMLAHNFTPNTFVAGEGATVSPCPQFGEYYRSQYWPPLSPNNATYLEGLRALLVSEDLDAGGTPSRLHLAPSTPRGWLADGQRIEVADLPTSFGPVGFDITSKLSRGSLSAVIDPPVAATGRAQMASLTVHLRAPNGRQLAGVKVNGKAVPYDADRELVDLGKPTDRVTVQATYRRVKVTSAPNAEVTTVDTPRTLVQPGEKVKLVAQVEVLGQGTVRGTTEVQTPAGWEAAPARMPFSVRSDGRLAWVGRASEIRIPADTSPGTYQVRLVARPDGGAARTRILTMRVAEPAAADYPDLVKADGPVGYWRLGEGPDQPVGDSSGNGNTGAYRGQVQIQQPGALADSADTAAQLAGGYAEIPDSPSVSMTGPYTLEAWVKDAAGGPQGVIEKYDAPARNGYLMRLVNGNKLQSMNLADTLYASGVSSKSVRQATWHHVASVYDGARLVIYIDGVEQVSTPLAKSPTDGRASLKLGARGDDAAERFMGVLDEVAVYDKALSPAQVEAHYVKGVLGDRDN